VRPGTLLCPRKDTIGTDYRLSGTNGVYHRFTHQDTVLVIGTTQDVTLWYGLLNGHTLFKMCESWASDLLVEVIP
jgi:hypothetical protein